MKEDALCWTDFPDEYSQHVKAGFGLWMDFDVRGHKWWTNVKLPEEYRKAVEESRAAAWKPNAVD